jgi:murein DD-endopeptidase MepM/ murein hydrolase activator NlpD
MGWMTNNLLRASVLMLGLSISLASCAGSSDTYSSSPNTSSYKSASGNKAPASVKVVRGDTVYGIGRRYGVSPQTIISLNNLRAPYMLEIGQVLKMPVARTYVVVKGDTLYGISRKHGVDMSELTRLNGLKSPYRLEIGDKLTLPPQARARVTVASGKSSSNKTPRKPVAAPPPRSGGGFAWPVNGKVLSSFGPKKGGLHNDGINIAAKKGASVKVTDAGTIAYAGNELPGYGNMILVRHSGGWVSAYGHLSQVLIKRGDKVKRGQIIARAGSTGKVTTPQLHFELRKGATAVDPKKYLPGV